MLHIIKIKRASAARFVAAKAVSKDHVIKSGKDHFPSTR